MDKTPILDLPHREARRLVDGGTVFVGVNPVEFHGPHLSLHNDAWISEGLAKETAQGLSLDRLLWAGDLEMGVEPCPGPGSRHVSVAVVTAAVSECCLRLFDLGVRRLVVMTFHGVPMHSWAIHQGTAGFRRRGGRVLQPLTTVFDALFSVEREVLRGAVANVDPSLREQILDEVPHDFHAGFFETSLSLHHAPHTVAPLHKTLPPCPPLVPEALMVGLASIARSAGKARLAAEFDLAGYGRAWSALRPFPGYTGQPAHASAAAGAFFSRLIVERYVAACRAVLDEGKPGPVPIMGWLRFLTLGGRLPTAHIDLDDIAS